MVDKTMAQRGAVTCKVTQWIKPGARFKYLFGDYSSVALSAVVQGTPVVRHAGAHLREGGGQERASHEHLTGPIISIATVLPSFGLLYGTYNNCFERFELKSCPKN